MVLEGSASELDAVVDVPRTHPAGREGVGPVGPRRVRKEPGPSPVVAPGEHGREVGRPVRPSTTSTRRPAPTSRERGAATSRASPVRRRGRDLAEVRTGLAALELRLSIKWIVGTGIAVAGRRGGAGCCCGSAGDVLFGAGRRPGC